MKVQIKETGEINYLLLVDTISGVDYSYEFLEDQGALLARHFIYDAEKNLYLTPQITYNRWKEIMCGYEEADFALQEFIDSLDDESFKKIVRTCVEREVCDCPIQDVAASMMNVMGIIKRNIKGKIENNMNT